MAANDATDSGPQDLHARAAARLRKKREFHQHALVYLIINGFLLAIWALSGAGYFWPIWPIVGWGIGIIFHGLDVYQRPISEADIRREIEHLR
jgi:hypothetical protein